MENNNEYNKMIKNTKNILPTIKYFILTIKHKFYVLVAGRTLNVSLWRLIKHDISKFYISELPHYGRSFFGDRSEPGNFKTCWTKHQNRNDHHWEYWIDRSREVQPIEMSDQAVREMLADWFAASKAYEGNWPSVINWIWLKNNFSKMKLHDKTKEKILKIINEELKGNFNG
jgi:hypothetical protein